MCEREEYLRDKTKQCVDDDAGDDFGVIPFWGSRKKLSRFFCLGLGSGEARGTWNGFFKWGWAKDSYMMGPIYIEI